MSSLPERSSAVMVLSKSGSDGSLTIAAISAVWSANACSNAGMKCSGLISPKGGVSNGVCQAARRGFDMRSGSEAALLLWPDIALNDGFSVPSRAPWQAAFALDPRALFNDIAGRKRTL